MTFSQGELTERNDDDSDAIVGEICLGRSVRQIAKSRGMSVLEVNHVLDLRAASLFSGEGTRRLVAAEAERLGALKQRLWHQAMTEGEGSLTASALYIKASERLSSLLGWNHPMGHVITILNSAPDVQESVSSTQRTLDAIRLLRAQHSAQPSEVSEDDDPS